MRIAPQSFLAVSVFTIAGLVGWAGCSSNAGPQNSIPPTTAEHGGSKHHGHRAGAYSNISHIFVIIQENRSLNDIYAGSGIQGANTTTTGEEVTASGEQKIALVPEPIDTQKDIDHCYSDAAAAINASGSEQPMDGFNNETMDLPYEAACPGTKLANKNPYGYVQQGAGVQPYWDLANNWILAANYFPTELGPSFVAHLNLIAGTTEIKEGDAVADYPDTTPWGCLLTVGKTVRSFGPGTPYATPSPYNSGPPCYDQFHTIADILDCLYCKTTTGGDYSAVKWRFYAPTIGSSGGIWSAFQAIKRIYGTHGNTQEWKNDVVSPDWQIFNHIPAGKLNDVGVTWVVPEFPWSDHAEKGLKPWGASWVGDIVNAIGESPLWPNSVIVVLWDDWGGWYDPATPPPGDFRGPGIRTPMLVISPYDTPANAGAIGHVSTEEFSSGSILKFIEQVYFKGETLGSLPCKANDYYYYYGCDLGYTDGTDPNTNSIGDVLNMNLSPRAYIPVTTKYPPSTFENSGNSYYYTQTAPDDQ